MKKTIFLIALSVSVIAFSSFTDSGESNNKATTTCDASNSQSCVIVFADGTRVDATGVLKTKI
jgi:hypothetical protein